MSRTMISPSILVGQSILFKTDSYFYLLFNPFTSNCYYIKVNCLEAYIYFEISVVWGRNANLRYIELTICIFENIIIMLKCLAQIYSFYTGYFVFF